MRFLVFTGQGSQWVGMCKDLYDEFKVVREVVHKADDAVGFNLSKLMFEGPDNELVLTQNAQPAILACSIAIYELVKSENDFDFDVCAGHSLGEYSALVAAGSLDLKDAIYSVHKRGMFMQEAVSKGVGAMAAVITDNHTKIKQLCRQISQDKDAYCDVANYNAKKQIIISGYKKGVDKVTEIAKGEKIGKVMPLNVSAPFHCDLMKPVQGKMSEVLDKIEFKSPNKPVIENVYSDVIEDKSKIKDYLINQIVYPVNWLGNINKAIAMGANEFIEMGPKNILTAMLKREYRKADIKAVVDLKSYNKYKEGL